MHVNKLIVRREMKQRRLNRHRESRFTVYVGFSDYAAFNAVAIGTQFH